MPASDIPRLTEAADTPRKDKVRLGLALTVRPHVRRQMTAEIDAQFAAFRATRLPLDQVNSHHHFHIHPTIAALVIAIGQGYGLSALAPFWWITCRQATVYDGLQSTSSDHPRPALVYVEVPRHRMALFAVKDRLLKEVAG